MQLKAPRSFFDVVGEFDKAEMHSSQMLDREQFLSNSRKASISAFFVSSRSRSPSVVKVKAESTATRDEECLMTLLTESPRHRLAASAVLAKVDAFLYSALAICS